MKIGVGPDNHKQKLMPHLRLVHSAPSVPALAHPCIDAFAGELDYVHQTLRWLGASASDLDDLAYETFLTLARGWPNEGAPDPLRLHLFGISYRVMCAYRGRGSSSAFGRSTGRPEPLGPDRLASLNDDWPALLQAALERIPLLRRAVLILHDLDDVPVAEIARTLALSRFGTRWRLRRARRELGLAVRLLRVLGARA
jgi:RNA polymerase sigma-70 factor (ECF subfamily)